MQRPQPGEYDPYYGKYMGLVPDGDIVAFLEAQSKELVAFLRSVPEAQSEICHPPYTWTFKQVLGHLTDTERIFGYRALRFARADATPLPGFDENAYVISAEHNHVPFVKLINEFESVRRSHCELFRNLPIAAWQRVGAANASPVSVRALAFIMAGHVIHHGAILRKRLGRS